MTVLEQNDQFHAHTDRRQEFTITDESGNAVDLSALTGSAIRFRFVPDKNEAFAFTLDLDAGIVKVNGGTTGKVEVVISETQITNKMIGGASIQMEVTIAGDTKITSEGRWQIDRNLFYGKAA